MKTNTKIWLYLIISFLFIPLQAVLAAGDFSIRDNNGQLTNKFSYNFTPGKAMEGQFNLVNRDPDTDVSVIVYPVDGVTSQNGGIAFSLDQGVNSKIYKWISLNKSKVTIAKNSSEEIKFKLTPPDNILPGTYISGVAIENSVPDQTDTKSSFSAQVKSRKIVTLVLNVPGEVTNNYILNKFNISWEAGNPYINFNFQNTGGSILSASGLISITNNATHVTENIKLENKLVLPGDLYYAKFPFNHTQEFYQDYSIKLNLDVGQYSPFDGSVKKLGNELKTITYYDVNWSVLLPLYIILALLIIFFIFRYVSRKIYLSKCENYTALENESIASIAQKFNMNWKKLVKINKIKAPFEIKTGQILLVRNNHRNDQTQK